MMKTYTELSKLQTFKDRFEYLKLSGGVGQETFGFDRYLNQKFYNLPEWKRVRREVILRDAGCDLGLDGYEIGGKVYIHHMNPITQKDILRRDDSILDPEFLICVSHETHNALHYGSIEMLYPELVERQEGDTTLWKRHI